MQAAAIFVVPRDAPRHVAFDDECEVQAAGRCAFLRLLYPFHPCMHVRSRSADRLDFHLFVRAETSLMQLLSAKGETAWQRCSTTLCATCGTQDPLRGAQRAYLFGGAGGARDEARGTSEGPRNMVNVLQTNARSMRAFRASVPTPWCNDRG